MSGDLVLVSPTNPELGFDVGKAMSRNRYIYCLGDAAVVVSSTAGEGGTWHGAIEGVKACWVPVWVKHSSKSTSGNAAVVDRGANWLPEPLDSIASLLSDSFVTSPAEEPPYEPSLFESDLTSLGVMQMQPSVVQSPETPSENTATAAEARENQLDSTGNHAEGDLEFYDLFLARLATMTASDPLTPDQIAEGLSVLKTQVDTWLRHGVSEGVIKRFTRPVRYQFTVFHGTQASLLSVADP